MGTVHFNLNKLKTKTAQPDNEADGICCRCSRKTKTKIAVGHASSRRHRLSRPLAEKIMKTKKILAENYTERINDILDISWRILKTRFIEGRHEISKEAPFQHYFANIITGIGQSFCTKRDDIFLVDLENKCENIKGKNKYIDITCEFPNSKSSCAIELKFKTSRQGAQDHGRIDAFIDLEALELVCERNFTIGRFYMITDSTPYINQSKKGVGTVFTTHDGAVVGPGTFHYPSKGRENIEVNLRNQYIFEWEKIAGWYFLQINISKIS